MASGVPKVRLVRCPKCLQILTEIADVPVYSCGGCGTVLQAKHRSANTGSNASEMLRSVSSRNNPSEGSPEIGGPVANDGATILSEVTPPFSTDATNSAMDNGEVQIALPPQCLPRSNSAHSHHGKEESSETTENGKEEIVSEFHIPRPEEDLSLEGRSEIFVAESLQDQGIQGKSYSLIEQMEESPKLSQHGSGESSPINNMEGSAESTDHCVVSEEDMVDRTFGDKPGDSVKSQTKSSSHVYYGSVSSLDELSDNDLHGRYQSLSRRTFRAPEFSESSNTKGKEVGEDTLINGTRDKHLEAHLQANLLEKASEERFGSAVLGSFHSSQNDLDDTIPALEQETSHSSDDFYSVQNWTDSEKDNLSRSLSKDSVFYGNINPTNQDGSSPARLRNLDHMELTKKVDELRQQFVRFSNRGKGNKRSHITDAGQEYHRPLFYNHESTQELVQRYNASIPRRPPRPFAPRAVPQQYQFFQTPLHYHPEDWRVPVKLPPSICWNNGTCVSCQHHVCHHPPNPVGPGCCHKNCNVLLCCHSSPTIDHELEKLHCKEKCQPPRQHCRPVSGAAPFVICYECSNLLQLPVDFLISQRKRHKLRCGVCSEVLIFSSLDGGHIVPQSGAQVAPPPSEVDNTAMDAVSGFDISVSHANYSLQGGPASYSEEYGPPLSKSDSTDTEPVPHTLTSSSRLTNRRDVKPVKRSLLHQLMGYTSARDILYEPSD